MYLSNTGYVPEDASTMQKERMMLKINSEYKSKTCENITYCDTSRCSVAKQSIYPSFFPSNSCEGHTCVTSTSRKEEGEWR